MTVRSVWERTDGQSALMLSVAAVPIGLIGAIAAFVLYKLILLFTNLAFYQQATFVLHYPPRHLAPWMILVPAAGGLAVGVMARYGSDRIRGHGIPEAMEAILHRKGKVHPKVAILKPISAAIAVGTGGPFGAEGPIIQTGGAIASLLGQVFHLTAEERKVFMGCGAAAGMVGIFNTPLAAVALVIELLVFEFRARSLIPIVIASAVAAAARPYLIGPNLMFAIPQEGFGAPPALILFIPLGIILGVIAVGFSKGLFFVEEVFEDILHVPMLFAPALGGLLLGLIAYVEPRVLGMGYDTIALIVQGKLGGIEALELGAAKSLALWVALGSGTSGGLLAPMILVGGAIGNVYGTAVAPLFPALALNPNACAVVGMTALFSAAARAPFTSFLFAFELTGDYHMILPLMIGCMVADVVARLLTEHSVMTERLAQRGLRIPSAYSADVLSYLTTGALMRTDIRIVPGDTPIAKLAAELRTTGAHILDERVHYWWLVETQGGHTFGLVTRRRLLQAAQDPNLAGENIACLAREDLTVIYPDEPMEDALHLMLHRDLPWLPVVDRANPRKVVGYITRDEALVARRMHLDNEVVRDGLIRPDRFRPARAQNGANRDTTPPVVGKQPEAPTA
ncbi:MAG TPA: chloride channel protein [Chloroflexota bacterium]|nr:chloride channel protein [Chloroflexota bacterium]